VRKATSWSIGACPVWRRYIAKFTASVIIAASRSGVFALVPVQVLGFSVYMLFPFLSDTNLISSQYQCNK